MLTTHALDTANGRPAAGMSFELWKDGERIAQGQADGNGRATLLEHAEPGDYEILWDVAAYFGTDAFLTRVPVRFRISLPQHYHVPLLVSPWSYSTYRGS
jgi:5-hydroxyisourate hydrolase